MDYLIPTAWETPEFELGELVLAVAAPPDRGQGRRRVGHGRIARRLCERSDRRALARRRAEHRHAIEPGQGMAGAGRGGPRGVSDVLIEAGRLSEAGEQYVLATVVSVRRPASAKRGDRAVVRSDGRLVGWVGGACSEPAVIREALRALADGEPRLLRICRLGPHREARTS